MVVGVDLHLAIGRPREGHRAGDRVERERVVDDARGLARLLKVGERELRPLHAGEGAVRPRRTAVETERVDPGVKSIGGGRVDRHMAADEGTRFVDAAGLGDVVGVAEESSTTPSGERRASTR